MMQHLEFPGVKKASDAQTQSADLICGWEDIFTFPSSRAGWDLMVFSYLLNTNILKQFRGEKKEKCDVLVF